MLSVPVFFKAALQWSDVILGTYQDILHFKTDDWNITNDNLSKISLRESTKGIVTISVLNYSAIDIMIFVTPF